MTTSRRSWSSEDGIALVLAMFMVLIVSLLGASLVNVGRTETMSSLNYKTMSQARYAAESGLHSAANYLIHEYQPPGVDPADAYANYNVGVSPVRYNNKAVVLTTVDGEVSNYPVASKIEDFEDDSHGQLEMSSTRASYTATATLLSMRQFPDAYSGGNVTIQTWRITGIGIINGAGAADVQVSAIIETQAVPAYRYAAFATKDGCDALYFGGGGQTDSYDSSKLVGGQAKIDNPAYGGDVGTNGSLTVSGDKSVVNGKLSTPRTGVGNCEDGNIVALDGDFGVGVAKPDVQGMVKLPQGVTWNDPAALDPPPPTTDIDFQKVGGCPAGASNCTSAGAVITITPAVGVAVQMGNVRINAGAEVHLNAGTYEVNSLLVNGAAKVYIDSGPVIFKVNGVDASGGELANPVTLNGTAMMNPSYVPKDLQFVYGGTGEVTINGGAAVSLLTYAPKASVKLTGGAEVYGAIVGATVKDMGKAKLHYDRQLGGWAYTEGSPTMTSFTWSSTD